jgi:hypothetical protein
MNLNCCSSLTTIQGFDELRALQSLNLSDTQINVDTLAGHDKVQNLVSPKHVDLHDRRGVTTLEVTAQTSLQYLDLSRCKHLAMLDVTGLASLQYFDLSSCEKLKILAGVNTLTALQRLKLNNCVSLGSDLNLTGLIHLQQLDLGYCGELVNVQGIDKLVSLRTLDLSRSHLSTILDLSRLTSLEDLNLYGCTALPAVTGISMLGKLKSLNMRHCSSKLSLSTSSDIVGTSMTGLRSLYVSNKSTLAYLQRQQLPALEELEILHGTSITTIDCGNWPSLTRVTVENCSNLTTLQGLDKAKLLKRLKVAQCPQLECLPELTCFKTLQWLSVYGCRKLGTFCNNLTDFNALRELEVSNSGIGLAISKGTDNNLVEQVSELKQRRHFRYHNRRRAEGL